jgi:ribonuclease BN (tRNA processing enzyme)
VTVYGPGPAGGLPPSRVGNADPATIAPQQPAPGLAATTAALQQAFAYTNNIFIRDMGIDDIADLAKVIEIAVPPGSDYLNRSPKTAPFPVMSDDNVTVTTTRVSHYDVYPAFAFRFDLKKSGVSVTFSGDTTKSDNLITLARDTDILVLDTQMRGDTRAKKRNRILRADLPARGVVHRVGREKLRAGLVVVHWIVHQEHHAVGAHYI